NSSGIYSSWSRIATEQLPGTSSLHTDLVAKKRPDSLTSTILHRGALQSQKPVFHILPRALLRQSTFHYEAVSARLLLFGRLWQRVGAGHHGNAEPFRSTKQPRCGPKPGPPAIVRHQQWELVLR